MDPLPDITAQDLAYWADRCGGGAQKIIMQAPPAWPDLGPCAVISTIENGVRVLRVPWQPDEGDIAALAEGGTVWLSSCGSLAPHHLTVQAKDAGETADDHEDAVGPEPGSTPEPERAAGLIWPSSLIVHYHGRTDRESP